MKPYFSTIAEMISCRSLKACISFLYPCILQHLRWQQPGIYGSKTLVSGPSNVTYPARLEGKPLVFSTYIRHYIRKHFESFVIPRRTDTCLQIDLWSFEKNRWRNIIKSIAAGCFISRFVPGKIKRNT